jgi:hypothetical protein
MAPVPHARVARVHLSVPCSVELPDDQNRDQNPPTALHVVSNNGPTAVQPNRGGRPRRQPGSLTHRLTRTQINMAEAVELSNALNFARHVPAGQMGEFAEPNVAGTVTWNLAEDGREPGDRIRDIIRRAAQFLRRAGEPFVWVWVQEVSVGKARHWHFTIYVPAKLQAEFKRRMRRWVTANAIEPFSRRAVYFKRVWGMAGWKQYLLKDGTDEVRAAFNVPTTPSYARTGGDVLGKRVAVSPTINAGTRAAAIWWTEPSTVTDKATVDVR